MSTSTGGGIGTSDFVNNVNTHSNGTETRWLTYTVTPQTWPMDKQLRESGRLFKHPHIAMVIPRKYGAEGFRSLSINGQPKDDVTQAFRSSLSMFGEFSDWMLRHIKKAEDEAPFASLNHQCSPLVVTLEAACITEDSKEPVVSENVEAVRLRIYFRDDSTLPYGLPKDANTSDFQEESMSPYYDCIYQFLQDHFDQCREEDKKFVPSSGDSKMPVKPRTYRSEFAKVRNWNQLKRMCALYSMSVSPLLPSFGGGNENEVLSPHTRLELLQVFSEENCISHYSHHVCPSQRTYTKYMNQSSTSEHKGYFGVHPIPNRVWMLKEFSSTDMDIRLFPWIQSDISAHDPLHHSVVDFVKGMSIDGQVSRIIGASKQTFKDENELKQAIKTIKDELTAFYDKNQKGTELHEKGKEQIRGLCREIQKVVLRPNARVRIAAQDRLTFEQLGEIGVRRMGFALYELDKQGITDPKQYEEKRAEIIRDVRAAQMEEFNKIWKGEGDMSPVCQIIAEFEKQIFRERKQGMCFPRKRVFSDLSTFGELMALRINDLEVAFKFAFTHDIAFIAFLAAMNTYAQSMLQLHTLLYGPPGTGKSYAILWILKLLIKGTACKFDYQSAKANASSSNTDDLIEIVEEMQKKYICSGHGDDEHLALWKAKLSSGESIGKTLWIDPETGKRSTIINRGRCNSTILSATNVFVRSMDPGLQSRLVMAFVQGHASEAYKMFVQSNRQSRGDNFEQMVQTKLLKWKRDQVFICKIQKAIVSGGLPEPDLKLGEHVLLHALSRGNERGLSNAWEVRHYDRMRMGLRTLVIWNAGDIFHDVHPSKETLEGNPDYSKVAPLLVATEEMAYFVWRLFRFQYDNEIISQMRRILKSSIFSPVFDERSPETAKAEFYDSKKFTDECVYVMLPNHGISVNSSNRKEGCLDQAFWNSLANLILRKNNSILPFKKLNITPDNMAETLQWLDGRAESRYDTDGSMKNIEPFKIHIVDGRNETTNQISREAALVVNKQWLESGGMEISTGERAILDVLQHSDTKQYKIVSGERVPDLMHVWKTITLERNPEREFVVRHSNQISKDQEYVLARTEGMVTENDYDPIHYGFDARKISVKEWKPRAKGKENIDTYFAKQFHEQIGWEFKYRVSQNMVPCTSTELRVFWKQVFKDLNNPFTPTITGEKKTKVVYTYEMFTRSEKKKDETLREQNKNMVKSPVKPPRRPSSSSSISIGSPSRRPPAQRPPLPQPPPPPPPPEPVVSIKKRSDVILETIEGGVRKKDHFVDHKSVNRKLDYATETKDTIHTGMASGSGLKSAATGDQLEGYSYQPSPLPDAEEPIGFTRPFSASSSSSSYKRKGGGGTKESSSSSSSNKRVKTTISSVG